MTQEDRVALTRKGWITIGGIMIVILLGIAVYQTVENSSLKADVKTLKADFAEAQRRAAVAKTRAEVAEIAKADAEMAQAEAEAEAELAKAQLAAMPKTPEEKLLDLGLDPEAMQLIEVVDGQLVGATVPGRAVIQGKQVMPLPEGRVLVAPDGTGLIMPEGDFFLANGHPRLLTQDGRALLSGTTLLPVEKGKSYKVDEKGNFVQIVEGWIWDDEVALTDQPKPVGRSSMPVIATMGGK